ncbi:hypothetical protein [Phormidesmis priestleyi]
MNRPFIVWVTQAIMLMMLFIIPMSVINSFSACLKLEGRCWTPNFVLEVALVIGIFSTIALGFWGLQHRKNYGRWLGVLVLAGFTAIVLSSDSSKMVYHFMLHGNHDLPKLYPKSYYKDFPLNQWSPTQRGLVIDAFVTISLNLLLIVSTLYLAFSKSIKAFFVSN